MKPRSLGALALTSVIVLGACQAGPAASGAAGQPAACQNKKGSSTSEIHVYSSLPRQASNKPQTDEIVEQIRTILDGQKVGNFTIKYTDLDDSSAAQQGNWDGAVAQANATRAAQDPDAMVFIGHFNSGAAKLTIPILNQACLVMISPANTYPGLTKAVEGVTEPQEPASYYPGGYRNYTRVVGTDDAQGAGGAEWAKRLGAKKVYVIDDTETYGKGLARAWAQHANKIGLEVVSPGKTSEGYDKAATDYAALAQKIKASGADFLYIGSITGNNTGKLWKDIRAALPDLNIMSGDGVLEEAWYTGTGDAGNDTYLTFGAVGPDQQVGAGKTFVDEYKAAHGGDQPEAYTIYGAAAAQVALKALQTANTNDRYAVLRAVMDGVHETFAGTMDFDANGDIAGGTMTAYQVETSWPPAFKELITAPAP